MSVNQYWLFFVTIIRSSVSLGAYFCQSFYCNDNSINASLMCFGLNIMAIPTAITARAIKITDIFTHNSAGDVHAKNPKVVPPMKMTEPKILRSIFFHTISIHLSLFVVRQNQQDFSLLMRTTGCL